jgi:hypothetical protein
MLVAAAAVASRSGADPRPFLVMAAALIPQAASLALTLRRPERREGLRADPVTQWIFRGIAVVIAASAIWSFSTATPSWSGLVAAAALFIASWPNVIVVVMPKSRVKAKA